MVARSRVVISILVAVLGSASGCGSKGGPANPDASGGGGDAASAIDGPTAAPDGPLVAVCDDSIVTAPETCDDGGTAPGDGCSATCAVEADFACPEPGVPCVRIVTCGNGKIEGSETCDDGNTSPDDGCSATCVRQDGWSCPMAGTACVAAACGDGIVAGFEACDDGASGAGCVDCKLEPGYHCPTPGAPCVATSCGDALPQGLEECDDGNVIVGDGCTPGCVREPSCAAGVCAAVCGDEVLQPGEGCDDGNRFNGDGCSSLCQVEPGFGCMQTPLPDPASVKVYATVRDFIGGCGTGARKIEGATGATAPFGHPDFECFDGAATGMVATDLDVERKPVRVANSKTTSDAAFAQWYRSDDNINRSIATELTLAGIGSGAYQVDATSFYPATGRGFDTVTCGGAACEVLHTDGNSAGETNFHFTSEVHFWFQYKGTETLAFSGDDDVWVFINGKLAVDIGGVHGRQDGAVTLATMAAGLGLTVGGTYEASVFQAERHTKRSQYRLTLTNFTRTPSTCTDACGDGAVSSREVCDQGGNNGLGDGSDYGGCASDCTLEPYCGDAHVDSGAGETCDDGLNLGGNASACAPGCKSLGARCGDGVVQTQNGEQCDDANTAPGDGCSTTCQIEIN